MFVTFRPEYMTVSWTCGLRSCEQHGQMVISEFFTKFFPSLSLITISCSNHCQDQRYQTADRGPKFKGLADPQ